MVNVYRYKVANGICIVVIALTKHIPSYLTIVGHRVLVSYDGQSQTNFGCEDMGHLYKACPERRNRGDSTGSLTQPTWADIMANCQRSQSLMPTDIREDMPPPDDQSDPAADRPLSDDRSHTTSNSRPVHPPTTKTLAPTPQAPGPFDAASEGMEQGPMTGQEEEERSPMQCEGDRIVSNSSQEERLLDTDAPRRRTSTKNPSANTRHARVRGKMSVYAPTTGTHRSLGRRQRRKTFTLVRNDRKR